jgi:hypothetical protein
MDTTAKTEITGRTALCQKFSSPASHARCDGTIYPEGRCVCGCHDVPASAVSEDFAQLVADALTGKAAK